MDTSTGLVIKFLHDDGAAAVEYALMVSCIAAVVVVGVTAFGLGVFGLFKDSTGKLPF